MFSRQGEISSHEWKMVMSMGKCYRAELTGLFGDPVDENPTGVMMEAGFADQGLNYRYITVRVEKGHLKEAMEAMRRFHMRGINLTIPHKVDVLPFLDELSPAAEIIGAVNSVRNQDGVLIGDNTDGKGFVTALMEKEIFLCDKTVTILGAGGAARAVAVECAVSGAGKIYIINRDGDRGRELSSLIQEKTDASSEYIPWNKTASIPDDTDILVNCTCVGLYPDTNRPDVNYNEIHGGMTVCDVVFNPPETGFLKEAKRRGAVTIDGLGMLVNQGTLNYSLWTENIAPKEVMKEALLAEFGLEKKTAAPSMDDGQRERALIEAMTDYYTGDPKRVQHFLKVYEFARLIGEKEELPSEELLVLRTAAIVHDIGIRISEEKYGFSSGKHQEEEGPAVAEPMLRSLGYADPVIDRVLYLIAHHHTYDRIDGQDYQILVEADFLVNLFEEESKRETCESVREKIFKTESGIGYLERLFLTGNSKDIDV